MRKKEIALILFQQLVELEKHASLHDSAAVDRLTNLALVLASEAGWDWERDTTYVQWCASANRYQIAEENLIRFTSFCEL